MVIVEVIHAPTTINVTKTDENGRLSPIFFCPKKFKGVGEISISVDFTETTEGDSSEILWTKDFQKAEADEVSSRQTEVRGD